MKLCMFNPWRKSHADLVLRKLERYQKTLGKQWDKLEVSGIPSFTRRRYTDYQTYLEHQKLKLGVMLVKQPRWLTNYDAAYRPALMRRLENRIEDVRGKRVLCLGARIGTEVRAFIDLGAFAVGIDLNPGEGNRFVVHGDFHELQFADASVDLCFTNSLDHAFDIRRLATEVWRVLAPSGHFVVEAVAGKDRLKKVGFYESFWWSSTSELARLLETLGFELKSSEPFVGEWPGDHLWFQKRPGIPS